MSHTPGPWEIQEGDRGECWWLDDERIISRHRGQYNEQCVCVLHGESQEGDKSLIAAAPELLAMLHVCHMTLGAIRIDEATVAAGLWQGEMIPRLLERIEALVSKAEGK